MQHDLSHTTVTLLLNPHPFTMVYYHTPSSHPPPPAAPYLLPLRSSTAFILSTVATSLFTDLFLYGLIVPILPFLLRDRLALPPSQTQSTVSVLLAAYAGASVLFSLPAGYIADRTPSRRTPFLAGLAALLAATVMLALGRSLAVLVAARVLQGISAAVVWTVGFAMVLDTVGPENLGKVVGSLMSFISVGQLAAPVVGGVLYEKTGYVGVFGVGAGMIGLDFVMRVLVIEKKTAAKYLHTDELAGPQEHSPMDDDDEDEEATEESGLLVPSKESPDYTIPPSQPRLITTLPILYCLTSPRILTALFLAFVEALLLATFDATIPTEASTLFSFSSLSSGLLFVPLDIPYLLLGPLAGWAVDRYGPKPAAVLGFGWLAATLVLLRLPTSGLVSDRKGNIVLYCGLLALNGMGMAIIGAPAIVEASAVVRKYDLANPGFFGRNGPYAQLYGCNSLVFSLGLTVGPLLSGGLRDRIGYGNMNAVVAGVAAFAAGLSLFVIGGRPGFMGGEKEGGKRRKRGWREVDVGSTI
jgi:MFS family permease